MSAHAGSDDASPILWLGGSPCSGKSSISRRLAAQHDLTLYPVDEAFSAHIKRLDATRHPALIRWGRLSWHERWMRPVEELVDEVIRCYREHFTLILEDVLALPRERPVLVEGTALLPQQVAAASPELRHALWVIPTAEFQMMQYAQRDWIRGVLSQCREPDVAFGNWMERDARFALWVADQARRLGYRVLMVDGVQSIEENARQVAAHFGLTEDRTCSTGFEDNREQ